MKNDNKLIEMVIFFTGKRIVKTKDILKALWKADSYHFLNDRHSISGTDYYQKLSDSIEPKDFWAILIEAINQKELISMSNMALLSPRRKFSKNMFSKKEIETLNKVYSSFSAGEFNKQDNEFYGWWFPMLKEGEKVDFFFDLIPNTPPPPTKKAIEYGKMVAKKINRDLKNG